MAPQAGKAVRAAVQPAPGPVFPVAVPTVDSDCLPKVARIAVAPVVVDPTA